MISTTTTLAVKSSRAEHKHLLTNLIFHLSRAMSNFFPIFARNYLISLNFARASEKRVNEKQCWKASMLQIKLQCYTVDLQWLQKKKNIKCEMILSEWVRERDGKVVEGEDELSWRKKYTQSRYWMNRARGEKQDETRKWLTHCAVKTRNKMIFSLHFFSHSAHSLAFKPYLTAKINFSTLRLFAGRKIYLLVIRTTTNVLKGGP